MKIVDTEVVFLTADEASTRMDVNAIICTFENDDEASLVNVDARHESLAYDIAAFLKGRSI